jgi:transposase
VTWWNFYFRLFPGTIRSPPVIEFLEHLLRHIPGKLLVVWDGLTGHRSRMTWEFIRQQRRRLWVEFLPGYAPELNPVEYLWSHWKQHELPNFCPQTFGQLSHYARKALRRMRKRPTLLQELNDLRAANGPGKESEVEVPPRHPRHGRQRLPVEVILQHRRLSLRRPGAAAVRAFAQSAFVAEDDGAALFLRFFLISGQRCCFPRRILSSSRSSARPTGRWQLQPNWRRIRHACTG